jgi:hypothetical protein
MGLERVFTDLILAAVSLILRIAELWGKFQDKKYMVI